MLLKKCKPSTVSWAENRPILIAAWAKGVVTVPIFVSPVVQILLLWDAKGHLCGVKKVALDSPSLSTVKVIVAGAGIFWRSFLASHFPHSSFIYMCVLTDTQLCVLGDYDIPLELAQPSACCLCLAGLQLRPCRWSERTLVSLCR